jgi:hypothetical protein
MLLIASVAAIINTYRWLYPPVNSWPVWRMQLTSYGNGLIYVTALIYLAWPFLAVGTLLCLAVRSRVKDLDWLESCVNRGPWPV